MSAQPPTSPRIEDLRARLRLDPKARHFYPLAEELRKLDQLDEAEKILRDGLTHHPAYLSAWMSLGRVLGEKGNHAEAVEALTKALALDPGNVVCANLLAASYLAMGERVEALKKLKLVRAVMPSDEVDEQIEALEKEIAGSPARSAGFAPPPPAESAAAAESTQEPPGAAAEGDAGAVPAAVPEGVPAPLDAVAPAPEATASAPESLDSGAPPEGAEGPATEAWQAPVPNLFRTEPDEEPGQEPERSPQATDVLPEEVFAPSATSEEPVPGPAAEGGGATEPTPAPPEPPAMEEPRDLFSEEPAPPPDEGWAGEPEEPAPQPAAAADDQTATLTMADLYARQGHDSAAREIYERVLEKDPSNEDVRGRLAALSSGAAQASPQRERRLAAAARLERWLEKVGRREL